MARLLKSRGRLRFFLSFDALWWLYGGAFLLGALVLPGIRDQRIVMTGGDFVLGRNAAIVGWLAAPVAAFCLIWAVRKCFYFERPVAPKGKEG